MEGFAGLPSHRPLMEGFVELPSKQSMGVSGRSSESNLSVLRQQICSLHDRVAEEEAKKESVKTFVPGEIPITPEVLNEEEAPKTFSLTRTVIRIGNFPIKRRLKTGQMLHEDD
ncbi:hypothetical protein LguiA_028452 [Lonicera macranthoides]